ncbi:MAG: homocysteine S-methyltransferase family protein [Oscillospiraceae bacterium]|nr:homocysteine S-methyltransferase family protein [Oscillospiraceae bacterium]
MARADILQKLEQGPLLFDGAMGTYYATQALSPTEKCEFANIADPEAIKAIHRAYIAAGCGAIKTNTFAIAAIAAEQGLDLALDLVDRAWAIAEEATAGTAVAIFADFGPPLSEDAETAAIYQAIADRFLTLGATNFLFETFQNDTLIRETAAHIRAVCPAAYIVASLAVAPDGFTATGFAGRGLVEQLLHDGLADAAGFNCVSGPGHLQKLVEDMDRARYPLAVMPNAGYPTVVGGRTIYGSSAAYFADRLGEMAAAGVKLLGGCCGTTPDYIRAAAEVLGGGGTMWASSPTTAPQSPRRGRCPHGPASGSPPTTTPEPQAITTTPESQPNTMTPEPPRRGRPPGRPVHVSGDGSPSPGGGPPSSGDGSPSPGGGPPSVRPLQDADTNPPGQNPFRDKLLDGQRVIAVELDSPLDSDIAGYMAGAQALKAAGADIITIADCPVARSRMDSSIVACKLQRELGIQALPHLTCRDRNLNATKALLLGLSAEGVHNVLIVTGDPVPTAEREAVKSVYNFNSRMLARYITQLNAEVFQTPFFIGGALNVNATNFDAQLRLAKEKGEHGVGVLFTQPVMTDRAAENLRRAREVLDRKILGGIMPIVSHRNAQFIAGEIQDMEIAPETVELFRDKSKEDCAKLGIELALEMATRIAGDVDGYYLITPFHRTDMTTAILEELT